MSAPHERASAVGGGRKEIPFDFPLGFARGFGKAGQALSHSRRAGRAAASASE